jgi:hypothetical protein
MVVASAGPAEIFSPLLASWEDRSCGKRDRGVNLRPETTNETSDRNCAKISSFQYFNHHEKMTESVRNLRDGPQTRHMSHMLLRPLRIRVRPTSKLLIVKTHGDNNVDAALFQIDCTSPVLLACQLRRLCRRLGLQTGAGLPGPHNPLSLC